MCLAYCRLLLPKAVASPLASRTDSIALSLLGCSRRRRASAVAVQEPAVAALARGGAAQRRAPIVAVRHRCVRARAVRAGVLFVCRWAAVPASAPAASASFARTLRPSRHSYPLCARSQRLTAPFSSSFAGSLLTFLLLCYVGLFFLLSVSFSQVVVKQFVLVRPLLRAPSVHCRLFVSACASLPRADALIPPLSLLFSLRCSHRAGAVRVPADPARGAAGRVRRHGLVQGLGRALLRRLQLPGARCVHACHACHTCHRRPRASCVCLLSLPSLTLLGLLVFLRSRLLPLRAANSLTAVVCGAMSSSDQYLG